MLRAAGDAAGAANGAGAAGAGGTGALGGAAAFGSGVDTPIIVDARAAFFAGAAGVGGDAGIAGAENPTTVCFDSGTGAAGGFGAAGAAAIDAPHTLQKRAPAGSHVPHVGHENDAGGAIRAWRVVAAPYPGQPRRKAQAYVDGESAFAIHVRARVFSRHASGDRHASDSYFRATPSVGGDVHAKGA
jgi:hypothetical protein